MWIVHVWPIRWIIFDFGLKFQKRRVNESTKGSFPIKKATKLGNSASRGINDSFSSYEDPKTLDLINYCTKHGQIYLYITHINWFCTNNFHIKLVFKNF